MKFVVCLKSTAVPAGSRALAVATSIRRPGDSVTAVCMGPVTAVAMLEDALCYGADEAFLLSDDAFAGADTHSTSRVLEAFITKYCEGEYTVLLQSGDSPHPSGLVAPRLAELLRAQQFCYVTDVERGDSEMFCTQDYGDETRRCIVPSGSVIKLSSCPSSLGRTDGHGEVRTLGRIDLGLGTYSCGALGSRVKIVKEGL